MWVKFCMFIMPASIGQYDNQADICIFVFVLPDCHTFIWCTHRRTIPWINYTDIAFWNKGEIYPCPPSGNLYMIELDLSSKKVSINRNDNVRGRSEIDLLGVCTYAQLLSTHPLYLCHALLTQEMSTKLPVEHLQRTALRIISRDGKSYRRLLEESGLELWKNAASEPLKTLQIKQWQVFGPYLL